MYKRVSLNAINNEDIIMKNIFRLFMPKSIKLIIQKIYCFFQEDIIDLLLGRRDKLTPTKSKIFVGGIGALPGAGVGVLAGGVGGSVGDATAQLWDH